MKLIEIEMDLPYIKNDEFIQKAQIEDNLKYEDAVRKDYEINWKERRREFQLMTRCMTAMIERIMEPINTVDCRKIIFECLERCREVEYKKALGVYVLQVPLNVEEFFHASDCAKKKMIINKVIEGINKLSNQVNFDLSNIHDACKLIVDAGYLNEWIWKKPLKIKNKLVYIKIKHEINDVGIYMIFCDKCDTVIKEVLLISTAADERSYDMYLGKLERISENEVALVTKSGEKYAELCE